MLSVLLYYPYVIYKRFAVQQRRPVGTCVTCHVQELAVPVLIRAPDSLTCFTIVGMEVLWEFQTLGLLLENFNIFGINFSCPC